MKTSARPVRTRIWIPGTGSFAQSNFTSSSRIRSAEMRSRSSRCSCMAHSTSSSTSNPSCATNRAARNMRSGSSVKQVVTSRGVRRRCATTSSMPPNGSTNRMGSSNRAIALTVKSRRTRSSSRESPNVTSGLRVTPSYKSARNVVISTSSPATRAPIVPNSRPVSQ